VPESAHPALGGHAPREGGEGIVRTTRAVILGLLLILLGSAAVGESSTPWKIEPSIGAISDTVAVISWETSRQVSVDLHYAPATIYDATGSWSETLTFDRQEGHAEVWLSGLDPDTAYRYDLIAYEGDAVYPSPVGSFRTSGPDVRSFTFVVYGNTRTFPDRHKLVADTVARDESSAAFVVHVGSLADAFTSERLANFHWAVAGLARSTPYLSVVSADADDPTPYFETFALPQGGGTFGEEWWSFRYGRVLLVGLDSSLDDPDGARAQQQVAWLRATLAASDATLCVVMCSDGLYSSATATGRNESLIELWEPVFREFDVDVVASASVGAYEHVYAGGVHYVTTGGGGGPLTSAPETRVPGLVFSRYGLLHYLRFTVADDAMRVEAVPVASIIDDVVYLTPNGSALDTFVVR
jgi:hypothetical protein